VLIYPPSRPEMEFRANNENPVNWVENVEESGFSPFQRTWVISPKFHFRAIGQRSEEPLHTLQTRSKPKPSPSEHQDSLPVCLSQTGAPLAKTSADSRTSFPKWSSLSGYRFVLRVPQSVLSTVAHPQA
jgi:hypothetical protein